MDSKQTDRYTKMWNKIVKIGIRSNDQFGSRGRMVFINKEWGLIGGIFLACLEPDEFLRVFDVEYFSFENSSLFSQLRITR